MNPNQLISDFSASVPELHRREVLLGVRLFSRYLRDHWYEATLNNGASITDAADGLTLLEQLVEALTSRATPATPTLRPEQPRWSGTTGNLQQTCPRCGHVHEGEKECGKFMGGGGFCRCELEVPA